MGKFAIDMEQFHVETMRDIDVIRRKVTLDVFSRVVKKTPVDTGETRGNWQTSVGAPILQTIDRDWDPTGEVGDQVMASRVTDPVFLSNNVPWILKLEFGRYPNPPEKGTYIPRRHGGPRHEVRSAGGFSKQAPRGMVRVTLEEFPYIVKLEANKNGFRD